MRGGGGGGVGGVGGGRGGGGGGVGWGGGGGVGGGGGGWGCGEGCGGGLCMWGVSPALSLSCWGGGLCGEEGGWKDGEKEKGGRENKRGKKKELFNHRMDGDKHVFEEVGVELGVDDRGWTHCVGVLDYDRDGWPDLFSMNDFGVSRVYRNREGKRFEEVSQKLGFNLLTNSMNFHLLDLDHTGRMSVYVTQIHKHTERIRYVQPTSKTTVRFERLGEMRALVDNMLFHPDDTGFYRDVHHIWVDPGNFGWAWDASTFDYENDGDEDLLVLNGTEGKVPGRAGEQRPLFQEGRTFISQHADQKNAMTIFEKGYL